MVRDILRWFRQPASPKPRVNKVPEGRSTYAIGDFDGRDDLFAQILEAIDLDHRGRPPIRIIVIVRGDLFDRGPESIKGVARAMTLGERFDHFHWLISIHEDCFLAVLSGGECRVRCFARIGGDKTIRSYWRDDQAHGAATFFEIARYSCGRLPPSHVDFLERDADLARYCDYVFAHDDVRPGVALDRRKAADLRWIREEFLWKVASLRRLSCTDIALTMILKFMPTELAPIPAPMKAIG